MNPPGVSKWSGVDAYCRLAGIDRTEVLAVGDGDNDVATLTHAEVAVAVRGGAANALGVADHVIGPPHQHGWASLLDLLGQHRLDDDSACHEPSPARLPPRRP